MTKAQHRRWLISVLRVGKSAQGVISPLMRIWGGAGRHGRVMELAESGGCLLAHRLGAAQYPALCTLQPQGPASPSPSPTPGMLPVPSLYWRGRISHRGTWGKALSGARHSARSSSAPGFGFTVAVCGGWEGVRSGFHLGVCCWSAEPGEAAAACL